MYQFSDITCFALFNKLYFVYAYSIMCIVYCIVYLPKTKKFGCVGGDT